jgi:hypothetical protein
MSELLVDDGEDVGDDDSDDEGYAGDGNGQNGDRRGDIVIVGGNRNNGPSQQRLTSRLPEWVGSRPNCPDGRRCGRQKEMSHAKERAYNTWDVVGLGSIADNYALRD